MPFFVVLFMRNFNKIKILIFLLLITCFAKAQHLLIGRTISTSQNGDIVQLASIVNKNTGVKKISNRKGYFSIQVSLLDTMIITAIGYDSVKLIIETKPLNTDKDSILIWMKPNIIQLREEIIYSSNPKRDSLARLAAEYLKSDPLMNNYDRILKRDRGGFNSPLTAIYNQFSKEGKDMAKFEEFILYMEKQKQVDKRYNPNVIKKYTSLNSLQIEEFMQFCILNKDFILTATEYDLIKAIKDCEVSFISRNKD